MKCRRRAGSPQVGRHLFSSHFCTDVAIVCAKIGFCLLSLQARETKFSFSHISNVSQQHFEQATWDVASHEMYPLVTWPRPMQSLRVYWSWPRGCDKSLSRNLNEAIVSPRCHTGGGESLRYDLPGHSAVVSNEDKEKNTSHVSKVCH